MTKYNSAARRKPEVKQIKPHPIWRGIGCVLMILIPIVSAALSKLVVDAGMKRGMVPYELMGNPTLPGFIYKSTLLAQLLGPFTTWTNFYAYAATTIIFIVLLGGVLSVVNAYIYQMLGPSRWGPQDVPPPKRRSKGYNR